MKLHYLFLITLVLFSCTENPASEPVDEVSKYQLLKTQSIALILLGTIQDAGAPHLACKKDCCKDLFENPDKDKQVISLGLIDNAAKKKYLFEATPDISRQMKALQTDDILNNNEIVDGIFLTHAHIGHYAGLMYLGKEAANTKNLEVFTMPKMKKYLETNGPWSQLVLNNNIAITQIENEAEVSITENIVVTPLLVPHRDEFSETVGYRIKGPNKSALFIPDIDKWNKWDKSIIEEIKKVDYAFLDATFYSGKEIDNRDISQIPHPFIIESLDLFKMLDATEKKKIVFIHFNHTNPVIDRNSTEAKSVMDQGFNIGRINEVYDL